MRCEARFRWRRRSNIPQHSRQTGMRHFFKMGIVSMEQAGNLLVIKTAVGMAMAVAAALDAMEIEGIIGCIAGDDTIMCAVKTEKMVQNVIENLQNLILQIK